MELLLQLGRLGPALLGFDLNNGEFVCRLLLMLDELPSTLVCNTLQYIAITGLGELSRMLLCKKKEKIRRQKNEQKLKVEWINTYQLSQPVGDSQPVVRSTPAALAPSLIVAARLQAAKLKRYLKSVDIMHRN